MISGGEGAFSSADLQACATEAGLSGLVFLPIRPRVEVGDCLRLRLVSFAHLPKLLPPDGIYYGSADELRALAPPGVGHAVEGLEGQVIELNANRMRHQIRLA